MTKPASVGITSVACSACGITCSRPMGERTSHPREIRDSGSFDVPTCFNPHCERSPFHLDGERDELKDSG